MIAANRLYLKIMQGHDPWKPGYTTDKATQLVIRATNTDLDGQFDVVLALDLGLKVDRIELQTRADAGAGNVF